MAAMTARMLPWTGVAAGVVWAGTQIVADLVFVGDPDPVGDPAGTLQALHDHRVAAMVSVLGAMYLAVLVVFFTAALRQTLGRSTTATAMCGGGVLLALAILSSGIGNFAVLTAANHDDAGAIKTLGYAESVTWPLLGAASGTFLLGAGITALRSAGSPRWLVIVTIVLGVLALLGPGAFIFWLVAPLWFAVAGIAFGYGANGSLKDMTAVGQPLPSGR